MKLFGYFDFVLFRCLISFYWLRFNRFLVWFGFISISFRTLHAGTQYLRCLTTVFENASLYDYKMQPLQYESKYDQENHC